MTYPIGALITCTSRVNGHRATSSIAATTCTWKVKGASVISSPSGLSVKMLRNHSEMDSR